MSKPSRFDGILATKRAEDKVKEQWLDVANLLEKLAVSIRRIYDVQPQTHTGSAKPWKELIQEYVDGLGQDNKKLSKTKQVHWPEYDYF